MHIALKDSTANAQILSMTGLELPESGTCASGHGFSTIDTRHLSILYF